MRARQGNVSQDKRSKKWNFFWWENGKKRCKQIGDGRYPTWDAAWRAAKELRDAVETGTIQVVINGVPTVSTVVEQYRVERMPSRYSTRRAYNVWLRLYVLPHWGEKLITELEARAVELWLNSLELAPRSRGSIRMVLSLLVDYAQWRKYLTLGRNPMELVRIKGSSKRQRKPRSLPVEEFDNFAQNLDEPFEIVALVQVGLGLRISECLGLKWLDVDWLHRELNVQRSIVDRHVDDTKTEGSRRSLPIDPDVLEVLKHWKQTTQFSDSEDWMFASPAELGHLPWSDDAVNDAYGKAAKRAGIAPVTTHCLRHTYRSWLGAEGTPIAVQQKLMRHADIRTTMNVYGEVVTDEMSQAASKVARLALRSGRYVRTACNRSN